MQEQLLEVLLESLLIYFIISFITKLVSSRYIFSYSGRVKRMISFEEQGFSSQLTKSALEFG